MNKPTFTIRIDDQNPVHARVTVFNRGGSAGQLCINTSDLGTFAKRLTTSRELIEEVCYVLDEIYNDELADELRKVFL